MKTRVLFVLALLTCTCISAQNKPEEVSIKPVVELQNLAKDSSAKPAKPVEFIEGTITPPEDQGFTKKIVNGKEIYYKESQGIMIQYDPK